MVQDIANDLLSEHSEECQDSTLGRFSGTLESLACATSPWYIIRIAGLPLKASDSSWLPKEYTDHPS
jgi:hypothetical protein